MAEEDKNKWVWSMIESTVSPEVLWGMSEEERHALFVAASGLYNWGVQHGRVTASVGTDPVYYVEQPLADIMPLHPGDLEQGELSGVA